MFGDELEGLLSKVTYKKMNEGLPPVDHSVEESYRTLPTGVRRWAADGSKFDAVLPVAVDNELKLAPIVALHSDYGSIYGPVKKERAFRISALFLKTITGVINRGCEYLLLAEGSPDLRKDGFLGIYFNQRIRTDRCGSSTSHVILLASRVNLYANWINHLKGLLQKNDKKVRYSRLSPFFIFYGDGSKKKVLDLLYLDVKNTETLKVLPGIKQLDANEFDGSMGIEVKNAESIFSLTSSDVGVNSYPFLVLESAFGAHANFQFQSHLRRDAINRIRKLRKIDVKDLPPPYPNGWYGILESSDLKVGEVKSIFALGEQLVAYRTREKIVYVLDAYCPHMGANLGIGGRVVDDQFECPFHQWRFRGSDGKCLNIRYAAAGGEF
uniref:Rieske domain-containing protein n=1 Tax=Glossina austeni TaxID=7395 RepID=A0A1A9VEM0_GLOAU